MGFYAVSKNVDTFIQHQSFISSSMNNAMKRYEFNYQQQKVLASGALNGKLGGNRDHNSKPTKHSMINLWLEKL